MIKNLKVKNKLLLGFGIVLVLLLTISVAAIIGIQSINRQNDLLVEKTLANTEYVWELRRNVISEQRYELMAFAEDDLSDIKAYLDQAQKESERNLVLLEEYKTNYRVEKSKVDRLEDYLSAQAEPRARIEELLSKGTAEANAQAFAIFENEFKPILDEVAELLIEIGNEQNTMAIEATENATNLYHLILVITVALILAALLISALIVWKLLKSVQYL